MIGICGRLRESVRTLFAFVCVACLILSLGAPRLIAKSRAKIFAQKLVETAVAKHHELSGVELSATPPGGHKCLTIASTETEDLPGGRRAVIGEKCDEDEFAEWTVYAAKVQEDLPTLPALRLCPQRAMTGGERIQVFKQR